MRKIFNLLIVCLIIFTFFMGSEVKAIGIISQCNDSDRNSIYCNVAVYADEPITDYEIRIGVMGHIKSINHIDGAIISPNENEIITSYIQSSEPLNKRVMPVGLSILSVTYEISYDIIESTWPIMIKDIARYIIPLSGFINSAPNSAGGFYTKNINQPVYLDIVYNKYADLTHDNYIRRDDLFLLKNFLRNKDVNTKLSESPLKFLRADANGDRIIDEKDLEAIYAYIDEYPNYAPLRGPLSNKDITIYGDTNLDGEVNEEDIILILGHTSGNPLIFSQSKKNSDVNNDGVIDVVDAFLVRKFLMGTHTSTPLNEKVYYYGDVDLDNKVGFSDIIKLIDLKYNGSSNTWSKEVLETLEMQEGQTPGFSEIISLINYVYEPHNITYDLNGGIEGDDTYIESFRSAKLPDNLPIPIKEGYYFDYWLSDAESFNGYDFTSNVIKVKNKDVVYEAIWERDML